MAYNQTIAEFFPLLTLPRLNFLSIMTETGSRFTLPEVRRKLELFNFSMQHGVLQKRIFFQ